jgi:magnesium-transporting ATPase (P-type)
MLPLIITIILTRESLLLAKEKVIVKRLSALESIGAVRFLLTDKTGTITENKLKVSAVSDVDDFWELMEQGAGADPIPGPTELVPSIGKRRKRLFEEKAWNKILLEGHLAAEQSYYKKIFETYPINRILGEY